MAQLTASRTTHSTTYPFISSVSSKSTGLTTSAPKVLITSGAHGLGRAVALSFSRHGSRYIAVGDKDEDFGSLAHDLISAATPDGQSVDPETTPKIVLVKLDLDGDEKQDDARRAGKFLRIGLGECNEGGLAEEGTLGSSVNLDVILNIVPDVEGDGRERDRVIEQYLIPLLGEGTKSIGMRTLVNVVVTKNEGHVDESRGGGSFLSSNLLQGESELGLLVYTVTVTKELLENEEGLILLGDTVSWLTCERREWLAEKTVDCTWDMKELADKLPER